MKRKQLNMMIVEIDELTALDNLSDELQQAIEQGFIQWPENQLSNTKVVDGKRLILILSYAKPNKLESWINEGFKFRAKGDRRPEEELETIDLGITWNILATEDKKVKQEDILPYIVDDVTFDEEENPIYTPVTDLTGRLQTWAGRNWIY
jgi:hypothetical protein